MRKCQLIPEQAFLIVPYKQAIFIDGQRMIYGGMALSDEQRRRFSYLTQYMTANKINLKCEWQKSMILRFLQSQNFNCKKVIANLQQSDAFQSTVEDKELSQDQQQIIQKGLLYSAGRDYLYRPLIILDISKFEALKYSPSQNQAKLFLYKFFQKVIDRLLIPGQVQNWHVLIDLKDISITSQASLMKTIINFLASMYRCRMVHTFLLNCPASIGFLWGMIKGMLGQRTAKKIKLSQQKSHQQLFQFFNRSQIQRKYGGTAANISTYFKFVNMGEEFDARGKQACLMSEEEYFMKYQVGGIMLGSKVCESIIEKVKAKKSKTNIQKNEDDVEEGRAGLVQGLRIFFGKKYYFQIKD